LTESLVRIRARREGERRANADGTWPAEARAGAPAGNQSQGERFGYRHALQRDSEKHVLQKGQAICHFNMNPHTEDFCLSTVILL